MGLWQAWISFAEKPSTLPSSSSAPSRSLITNAGVSKPRPLFSSAQMVSIAALSFLHVVSGLVASHRDADLADSIGSAVPLERSCVALVFFLFSVVNLLRMNTSFLPLPHEILCLIGLFAFGQELLLFHLQRPDAGLESRYYTLLLVPIGASILALVSSIVAPMSLLPPFALAGSLFLQGSWLIQMGLSFFTTAFISKGCLLHMRGDGDYVIKCDADSMALMRGKAVATLQFNCHLALLLILFIPLYSFLRRHCGSSTSYALNYEMVATVDSHNAKSRSDVLSSPPPSAFSLELDEDLDDDERSVSEEHRHGANGFHGVALQSET
ncbi:hypothetical protein GOP47_0001153 [Adiantum capillus-veneris]|uniref:Transmembrane protein n=1 Tax=Adiantum capillus-veneris TaxID=13818 RepID=A0A9D4ZR79_ADICA|nr:hypothetical protein GOP47_0001153 [Adiantum capillus-veneris]